MTNSIQAPIKRQIAETFIKATLDLIENRYYTDGEDIIFWCQNNPRDLDDRFFPISYCFNDYYSYELETDWSERLEEKNLGLAELIEDYIRATSEDEKQTRDESGEVFDWVLDLEDLAIDWASKSEQYHAVIAEIQQEERERLIDWAEESCDIDAAKDMAVEAILQCPYLIKRSSITYDENDRVFAKFYDESGIVELHRLDPNEDLNYQVLYNGYRAVNDDHGQTVRDKNNQYLYIRLSEV